MNPGFRRSIQITPGEAHTGIGQAAVRHESRLSAVGSDHARRFEVRRDHGGRENRR